MYLTVAYSVALFFVLLILVVKYEIGIKTEVDEKNIQ